MMPTVTSLREEFIDEFTEQIVTVDHNVGEKFEQEFSFHAVCHPNINENGTPIVPEDIQAYVKDIAEDYQIQMLDMHVHIQVELSREQLGIEEEEERVTRAAEG